jgi:hypothetical protein
MSLVLALPTRKSAGLPEMIETATLIRAIGNSCPNRMAARRLHYQGMSVTR